MRKVSSYKCPICKMEYKTLGGWSEHMHRHHPDEIPKGFTDLQYFYYTLTGKKSGSCVQCHKPTDWNEATGKYNRYCNNPKCKEQYCKVAKKRMIDKYGKIHLLNDPEMQRKMLSNRKIAGTYTFSDGSGKVPYVASYEKDFLMTMDTVLGLKATDIMSPSPHNYVYMYEGKPHFYIPDFYIPSLNLEIEIKDDQNGPNANKHPKIAAVDRVKEALKDETMAKNKSVNYFKVMDKSYTDFFKYVLELKECIDDDLKNTIISAMAIESVNDPENSFEMALERALEYDDDEEFNGEGNYGFEVVTESVHPVDYNEYQKIYDSFATEATFINHKDEYFNLDDWKREVDHNILYITGLSGSGKSTLGRELAKTYGAMYIELDRLKGGRWLEDAKFNPDGYQNNATAVLKEILKDEDPDESSKDTTAKAAIRNRRFSKVYEYCMNRPEQLFIIEGWQIFVNFDFNFLIDKPLIIKNTSVNTSFKRMTLRERQVYSPEQLKLMKAVYKGNEHDLESLRKLMRSKAKKSKSLPAVESVNTRPHVLYHGSNTKVSSITPHVSTHGKSWVYATADHDFALCYSGKQWDDLNINQAYHNGQLTLTEIEKGAFDKYFNCPGYIYSFPGDNFKEFNRHELVSDKEVVLGDNSVEYVPNVMDAIKKSGIKLYRYPNLPPYIKNREEYIRKKKELFANVSTLESTDEIYDEVEPVMEDSSKPYMPYHEYRQKLGLNSNRPISGGEYSDRMAKIRDEQLQKMQRQREKEREKQREKWREEAREKERANHTAEPNNDILYFSSPKELHTWMKNNISYANFTKLISPEEMLAKKRGSCHDQALFAYKYLKRMGLKPKLLFFIAYKEGEVVGGMTHTLCYYEQDNKVWWFETAWNGAIGLRSYPTENAMRVDIFRRYMNLPDSKKFPELEFKEITPMEPGYNLAQYVDKALEVALTTDERTDFGIPSLKKYPMPDPDHVKAAIRMFNHVDEEHEKELANNIIKYIKKYKMTDINVGKDNRFHKYYSPSEDAVITDVASQVPYGGAVIQRPMN